MLNVYAQTPFPPGPTKSIFLAGPTDRRMRPTAWRMEALRILRQLDFDGQVLIPEMAGGAWNGDLDTQFKWEDEALTRADVIAFWVPRDLTEFPGFTTNIEWGLWANSGKVVWGAPEGTPGNKWAERYAQKFGVPIRRDLGNTLSTAMRMLNEPDLMAKKLYPKPSLTADAVRFYGDKVLLVKRKNEPYKGSWAFPGGYVNEGEEPYNAVIREQSEETHLAEGEGLPPVEKDELELVGVYGKPGRDPRGWVVSVAYTGESSSMVIEAGDDAAEAVWMPISKALRENLAFDHSIILRDALIHRLQRSVP